MVWDWENAVTLASVLALLLLAAYFSAAETALLAASKPRMQKWADDGNRRAALVNRLRDKSERTIGAILVSNNILNILSSSLTTSALIALAGDAGVIYATAIMSVLVVVFGEMMPKTYAINHADRTAVAVAPVVNLVVRVLAPILAAVGAAVRWALRILGAGPDPQANAAEEELRGAIELHQGESEEEGRVERRMLKSVLDLGEMTVEEVMVHRRDLQMLDASLPPRSIVEAVLASPFTRLPIWLDDTDNIVGVLHAKALFRALQVAGGDYDKLDIQAIANEPWFIPNTTYLSDQLQAFLKRREHFALVIDEYGTLMGVATLEDIIEEITGDITDEHDQPVVGVRPQPDGSLLVKGSVAIRDLNRRYDWKLPHEDYTTIAGLVLYEARRLPEIGQRYSFYGFDFQILRRKRHQVTLLKVMPPQALRRISTAPPLAEPGLRGD